MVRRRTSSPPSISEAAARKELEARLKARKYFLHFMQYCWWFAEDFKNGIHLGRMAVELDRALDRFLKGKSTFLCFMVPFRHGKSVFTSIGFPAYFLGRLSQEGLQSPIMQSGYGATLVEGFSQATRTLIESPQYQRLFPKVKINRRGRCTNEHWSVKGWPFENTAASLGGAITGFGFGYGNLDDFCKKRREIESPSNREALWTEFTQEFQSRRADPAIIVVTATPWDTDDIFGRIRRAMGKDRKFPRYRMIQFPAKFPDPSYRGKPPIPIRYLWPERFSPAWYESQYATLGPYASAGLLDCSPRTRSGFIFTIDPDETVVIHDNADDFPLPSEDTPYYRPWDLASTEKQVAHNDPDFTAGPLMTVTWDRFDRPHIWVKDLKVGQWNADKRDNVILDTAMSDPPHVLHIVEGIGGYKDAAEYIERQLIGHRDVVRAIPTGSKFLRITSLLPIFKARHFHVLKADWNETLFEQFRGFPKGHDDIPDAISTGFGHAVEKHKAAGNLKVWVA